MFLYSRTAPNLPQRGERRRPTFSTSRHEHYIRSPLPLSYLSVMLNLTSGFPSQNLAELAPCVIGSTETVGVRAVWKLSAYDSWWESDR